MGEYNSRAAGYCRHVARKVRQRERERERLEGEHREQADYIISEILRCIKPQYLDRRKANTYLKRTEPKEL